MMGKERRGEYFSDKIDQERNTRIWNGWME